MNDKHECMKIYRNALRKGHIKRAKKCEICGYKAQLGHHPDYSKPLDVEWLCIPCHNKLHSGIPIKDIKSNATPPAEKLPKSDRRPATDAFKAAWKSVLGEDYTPPEKPPRIQQDKLKGPPLLVTTKLRQDET